MAQPKKSPVSVRLPPDVLAKVDIWAARRGIKRNAALVEMLRDAKPATELPKAKPLGRAASVQMSEAVPVEEVVSSFNPPVGPPTYAPGSLAKKTGKR